MLQEVLMNLIRDMCSEIKIFFFYHIAYQPTSQYDEDDT